MDPNTKGLLKANIPPEEEKVDGGLHACRHLVDRVFDKGFRLAMI